MDQLSQLSPEAIEKLIGFANQQYSSVDTIWVLLGAALVFFMHAGFTMVEAGFTRAKNAGNIIMKNLLNVAIGSIAYWLVGFGIMFGASSLLIGEKWGLIGSLDFMVQGNYDDTFPTAAFLIFQTVFCATAATIVSGAMAERTKFASFCFYALLMSAVAYPISGHWIWGGGWLAELGFHDFAGSTAVHMVGGVAGFIGAWLVGARIGKYSKTGESRAIPGHSLTLGALGVIILWLCWFGFNGCSTVSMTGDDTLVSAASIFITTNLAASAGAVAAMITTWIRYGKPDVSMTLNGTLAGLVGITAGCDAVDPFGALCIGLISGVVVVFGIEFIDKVLKVDDPVGAIGVHGVCGAVGTLLVGLFALEEGLFYGGGVKLLGIQAIGVVAVAVWVAVTMTIVFTAIKLTMGLRVSRSEEISGLDISEHALSSSYADFVTSPAGADFHPQFGQQDTSVVPHEMAIPVVNNSKPDAKMTKVVIVTRQNKFEALKAAFDKIGVTGMTVTQVLGFGMQKGNTEYYRGVPLETTLLPKVKVEVVICKIPVGTLVETVKKALYTGNIGDGKIFIYDVENVIKVRTGEQGYDALQDE